LSSAIGAPADVVKVLSCSILVLVYKIDLNDR
jgi:hypothetical protein